MVDFSTAGIGFVMAMNPAALRGAPHTHIATIYAEEAAEGRLLRELAAAYPNITAIRVRDAIDRVSEVLAGIAAAVTYGAAATLVTGDHRSDRRGRGGRAARGLTRRRCSRRSAQVVGRS